MDNLFLKSLKINWDSISAKSYIRNIEALSGVERITFNAPVTFFVGENGTGKSTLLEAIAIAAGFNPEGGTRNYDFSTYDDYSELYSAITLSRSGHRPAWGYFLRAESFYNVATMEEEYSKYSYYAGEELHYRSHGESFMHIVQKHFQPKSFYILDEPEAALSPQRQLTLLIEISNCVKEGSQFIIVSHSPILLGIPGAEILSFDNGKIHKIGYEDTESYKIIKLFVNEREAVLKHLLTEE